MCCVLQVRVVCSSNGNFIRQPGGHFEYEGGDTRLVSVSNWFTLASLKEAMERVVVRPASSRSQSGPPDVSMADSLAPHPTLPHCQVAVIVLQLLMGCSSSSMLFV